MEKSLPGQMESSPSVPLDKSSCQCCGQGKMHIFHQLKSVPTNSCILLPTSEEAIGYPRGDIFLGFCPECGFISNTAFEQKLTEYSERYEETQGFSATFNKFQQELAEELVKRYRLYDKNIIEIGCGKGEFLTLVCELGQNRGVGFDPGYIPSRNKSEGADNITFIKDFYSESYAQYTGDFIICKMTLEHIPTPYDFLQMIRRSLGNRSDTVIFIQVPDVSRILKKCSFEDIYYEHCSYFSLGSLSRLFRKCGLNILHLSTDYEGQYILIEADPDNGDNTLFEQEKDIDMLKEHVNSFKSDFNKKLVYWSAKFNAIKAADKKVVLWGSGSKGVSFLTTLSLDDSIEYVVDINPYRQGFYMAGSGQKIVAPEFLKEYRPDVVVIMNSVYREEVRENLETLGLSPEIITI